MLSPCIELSSIHIDPSKDGNNCSSRLDRAMLSRNTLVDINGRIGGILSR